MSVRKLKKLFGLLKVPYFTKNILQGVAASTEHLPILYNLYNIKTIIDIGANKGQFTLAARYVFPEAQIISFEPLSAPAEKFNKLFKNDEKVILHQSAIGTEKKTLAMHVSKRDHSSSILPIGVKQASIFPGTDESHTENITVSQLNRFISSSDLNLTTLLKIDVQGYELNALNGCIDLIDKFDYIYVECAFIELYEGQALADEVINYLAEYSFKLKGVYNTFYDKHGTAVQVDILFINNSKEI